MLNMFTLWYNQFSELFHTHETLTPVSPFRLHLAPTVLLELPSL